MRLVIKSLKKNKQSIWCVPPSLLVQWSRWNNWSPKTLYSSDLWISENNFKMRHLLKSTMLVRALTCTNMKKCDGQCEACDNLRNHNDRMPSIFNPFKESKIKSFHSFVGRQSKDWKIIIRSRKTKYLQLEFYSSSWNNQIQIDFYERALQKIQWFEYKIRSDISTYKLIARVKFV